MIRRVPILNTVCNISEYTNIDCPKENVIFVFKTNHIESPVEFWKISLDLLNKSKFASEFHEDLYFCNDTTPLNEIGYVILQFENIVIDTYRFRNYLILALLFYNNNFKFDEITLQNAFNELSEEEQDSYAVNSHDWFGIDDIPLTGLYFEEPEDDLVDFILENTDEYGNITPVYEYISDFDDVLYEIELENQKKKTEQKKLIAKYKRRETKYKKTGCKILPGLEAFHAIRRNCNFSMLAIDTDDFYSIEYNQTQYLSDYDEDYYTITKIVDGKMRKEVVMDTFFFCDVIKFNWAIVKCHSGFMEMI